MALRFYRALPASIGTVIDDAELFIGDGVSKTFSLTKLPGSRVSVVQVENLFFTRDTIPAGFTVSGNDITLLSAPANGAKVIVVGTSQSVHRAFDTATAGTSSSANIQEVTRYIGDTDEIHLWSYGALPGKSGIEVSWTDGYTAGGADPSWMQFAPLNADLTPGSYLSAGTAITLGTLDASDEVQVGTTAGDTVITVADGSLFTAGRFIKLNPGGPHEETKHITSIAGNDLTISATDYDHDVGERVYENLIGFSIKLTVPIGVTGGITANLFDNLLTRKAKWSSRAS